MTMPPGALRPALYHRFHRLLPMVVHPAARRLWRAAVWAFWLAYFGFVLLVLALRYAVLPQIENYRGDIERLASGAIGLPVAIGRVEAGWDGLRPQLSLYDVRLADAQGRPALAFAKVESILSWSSLPHLQLRQHLMQIDEPTLHVRREADGKLYVAGIPVGTPQGGGELSAWLLAQEQISIRGATLVWEDALRQAPQLVLEDVGLSLRNNGRHHRFGLTALPPEALASRLDLRGDLRGKDLAQLEKWQGQLYAAIDYADLAAWRPWFDYPFALPQGRGAVRAWAGVGDGKLRRIAADVALHEVRLQLARDLPEIGLDRLQGRFGAKLSDGGFEVSGQRLELATRDGLQVAPTDFHLDWRPEPPSRTSGGAAPRGHGSATASEVDLGALAALAGHLPLDARTRRLLQAYAPRGRVADLRADWRGDAEALQSYTLKARFDGLGLQAQGALPGFANLSGELEASEKGGSAKLRSAAAAIDLPGVFPEPRIALDTLKASAKWKLDKGEVEADLSQLEFANADAAGSAEGSYRYNGEGPGRIDLQAALSRADARAVWRYMPKVVNAGARDWLRRALTAGAASEAKLVLKGDLRHFPFLDKSQGKFLVSVKAQGVTIDYASSWPKITDIAGDVRFEGAGMVVDARRGAILGARVAHARAEIPDFDAAETMLLVKGRAAGPTAEFLKFIEASPVGDKIDHFTVDMRAGGNGQLDLDLKVPLDRAVDASLAGDYQFIANQVSVDPGLPPLTQVNGHLHFTGDELRVPEINASLLGGPVRINARTQPDGRVLVAALGTLSIAQLKKQYELPLLDHLSGAAGYRGEVRVKKRSADLVVDSNLVGIASSLPAPLNKSAAEPLALHFEKAAEPEPPKAVAPVARERISLALGKTAAVQLVRRKQGEGYAVERGAVAVGEPLVLPDKGWRLGVSAPRVDLDFWRQALRPGGGASAAGDWPPLALSLKAAEVSLFGHDLHAVDFRGGLTGGGLKAQLKSREANGELGWDGLGRGKLTARLKNLSLEPEPASPDSPVPAEALDELPALDVVADEFKLGARRFGRLEVQARNEGSVWLMDKVAIANPHGSLVGSGRWRVQGGNRTQLEFRIDSNDVGKLLERLDYPGAVRGGSATLSGKLGWFAAPTALDYPTLVGEMRIESAKGQFAKLDTGAGKLLGLLSLQALPRRITLDFRDVFSEGFAYDSIAGDVAIQNGVMHTDRLQIDGPAARILMRGDADLKQETQDLRVSIQPELGGPAAAGLALVNPIAGVAALLAHKFLQNPLNQIFAFDYRITGHWDDPKVEKAGRTPLAPPSHPTPGADHDATRQ